MPRNIKKQDGGISSPGCSPPQEHGVDSWYLYFQDEHACLYKGAPSEDEQALIGPVVFCCERAVERFVSHFPNNCLAAGEKSDNDQDGCSLQRTPAEQIISWMDAGIQAIYFIFCLPGAEHELSAAVLTGNQARQALIKEIQLEYYQSAQILAEIGLSQSQDGYTPGLKSV